MKKIFILLILLVAVPCFAADIYIDPTWGGTEAGTFAQPYNSWTDFTITAGNDYRQKCGTTYNSNGTVTLNITASGTSGNYILIGAYEADGDHEDDHPSFGLYCQDGTTEKPKITNGNTASSGRIIVLNGGGASQYIEINSLQLRDTSGEDTTDYHAAVDILSSYNIIRYLYILDNEWGITTSHTSDSDYNLIEYNYIDLSDNVDQDGYKGDAIDLRANAQNNTVQYNHVMGWDHFGVFLYNGDSNTVQYNYLIGSTGHEDVCIGTNPTGSTTADSNIVKYNYCNGAQIGFQGGGGDSNEIYGNIFDCSGNTIVNYGCVHIYSYPTSSYTNDNNLFYNNVIYDHDANTNQNGIMLRSGSGNTASISGNYFVNNVILKVYNNCIRVVDDAAVIGTNYYYNNDCYDYGGDYASIEGSSKTFTTLNAEAYAQGNNANDPGLKDAIGHEFWPASGSSNLVGNGYDLGTSYDDLLDPDVVRFTATPPVVLPLQLQPSSWIIGPYGYPSTQYCGTEISQTATDDYSLSMHTAGQGNGQSFVANKSISDAQVKVTFKASSPVIGAGTPSGNSYIRIDDGTDMSSGYLCQSSAFEVTQSGDMQITIEGCTLTDTITYYVGLRHLGGDANNYYTIALQVGSDEYADGQLYQSTGDWVYSAVSGDDMYFKIELCDESPPAGGQALILID